MHIEEKSLLEGIEYSVVISFSWKDLEGVLAYEKIPMVIKVQIQDLSIKIVLIDPVSSADVLYWVSFKWENFDTTELLPFIGALIGFSGEHV